MNIHNTLTAAGYKFSQSIHYRTFKSTTCLYQKRIRDENGDTKYFVNAWYYPAGRYGDTELRESVQFEAQLRKPIVVKDDTDVDNFFLDISPHTDDNVFAEQVIEKIWQSMEMGLVDYD